jgi:hypothetical protein
MTALLTAMLLAKAWNGITPGVSTRDEVVKKFGEPSKVVAAGGREVLAYQQGKLIKGTTQAQFKVDPKTSIVERIDVFPAPVLSLEDIASAYGPLCSAQAPETREKPCYLKREDEKKMYVVYVRLGLAVFFTSDGKSVQTFAFLPEKKE